MTKRLPPCYAVIASLNTFNSRRLVLPVIAAQTGIRSRAIRTTSTTPSLSLWDATSLPLQNQMQVGAKPSSTKRVFPDNVRPLNSAVEDSAAPVFPGKDLPVFPPEQGPDSIRITRRDSTSVTLAWDAPEGTIPTMYNLLMVSTNQDHIPFFLRD